MAEFPEGVKATFVGGEVLFDMSPEGIRTHNQVKLALIAAFLDVMRDEDLGELYPDGALLSHEEANLSAEPDLLFAKWATFESGRLHEVPRESDADDSIELMGTPDLVVEVVSKSSVKKDLRLLREGYARAGIREYWLVDARKGRDRFEILRLEGEQYVSSQPSGGPQSSSVLRRQVAFHRSKNQIDRWRYRFEMTKI